MGSAWVIHPAHRIEAMRQAEEAVPGGIAVALDVADVKLFNSAQGREG